MYLATSDLQKAVSAEQEPVQGEPRNEWEVKKGGEAWDFVRKFGYKKTRWGVTYRETW